MTSLTYVRVLRQVVAFAIGFALAAVTLLAAAANHLNVDRTGLALRGYDPVAYFTQGRPVPGKRDVTAEHAGATYRFVSPEHRDAFQREPGRYVPEYGGYCAYGAVLGKKLDGDPEVWRIVDGKLYLNLNRDVQKLWIKDIPGYIEKANANWPRIKDQLANAL